MITPRSGAVLVTDAMAGMGVRDSEGGEKVRGGCFSLGEGGRVEVSGGAVRLAGTSTLAGRSVSSLRYTPPEI